VDDVSSVGGIAKVYAQASGSTAIVHQGGGWVRNRLGFAAAVQQSLGYVSMGVNAGGLGVHRPCTIDAGRVSVDSVLTSRSGDTGRRVFCGSGLVEDGERGGSEEAGGQPDLMVGCSFAIVEPRSAVPRAVYLRATRVCDSSVRLRDIDDWAEGVWKSAHSWYAGSRGVALRVGTGPGGC